MGCCSKLCSISCKSCWEPSVSTPQTVNNTPSNVAPESPVAARGVWSAAGSSAAAGGSSQPQSLSMFGVASSPASSVAAHMSAVSGSSPARESFGKEAEAKMRLSSWQLIGELWESAKPVTAAATSSSSSAAGLEEEIIPLPAGKVLRQLEEWEWLPISKESLETATSVAKPQPSASRGRMRVSHKPTDMASASASFQKEAHAKQSETNMKSESKMTFRSQLIPGAASAATAAATTSLSPLRAATVISIFPAPIPLKIETNTLKKWIEAHERAIQPGARTLVRATTYIPHEVFIAAFKQTIEDFESNIANDPNFQYLSVIEPAKSLVWMNDIAKGLLKKKPEKEATISKFGEFLETVIKIQNVSSAVALNFLKNIVVFDDGIYSGKQITGFIVHIKTEIEKSNKINSVKLPMPNFIVACPFITEKGAERIRKLAQDIFVNVTIVGHRCIETLNQALRRLRVSQGVIDKVQQLRISSIGLEKEIMDMKKNWGDIGMCFFDHKIPDYLSFPKNLSQGIVMKMDGETNTDGLFQFLPDVSGPYHIDFNDYCREMNKTL